MARIVLRGINGEFRGRTWESSDLLRVGRLDALEVVLDDSSVSRSHAEVRCTRRGWRVRDLGSTNGTRLNGARIGEGRRPLRERDLLQFGEVAVLVESITESTATDSPVPVTEPEDRIILRGINGAAKGRTWKGRWLLRIGHVAVVSVDLEDESVSRYHAEVRRTERGWSVEDLGSENGTFLNGVRIGEGEWPLRDKDLLHFGGVAMVVETGIHPTASEMLKSAWAMGESLTASRKIPISPRKLRLLASACFRRSWREFPVESTRPTESHEDGLAGEEESRTIIPVARPLVGQASDRVAVSEALGAAERYADGLVTDEELASARLRFGSLATDQRLEENRQWPLGPIRGMADVAFTPGPIRWDDIFHDFDRTYVEHRPEDAMDGRPFYLDTLEEMAGRDYYLGADPSIWRAEYFPILEDMVGPLPSGSLRVDPSWLALNDGVLGKMAHSIYDARSFDDMPILGDALEDCGCTEEAILRHCRGPGRHFRGCWVLDLLMGRE